MRLDHKQYTLRPPAPIKRTFDFDESVIRVNRELDVKNRLRVNDIETFQQRGQRVHVNTVVSGAANTHFAQLSDYAIAIKDVTISRGVQLPQMSLVGIGKLYVVKDISGSATATTITVAAYDGESIDGEPTDSIISNWGVKKYVSDGSNWYTW